MLPRQSRFDRGAFTRAFAAGRRVHTPLFSLIYRPAPALRGAAVVSKKVAKSAAARNLLRRRIYAALAVVASAGGEVIVVAKPPARSQSYAVLEAALGEAYARAVGFGGTSR